MACGCGKKKKALKMGQRPSAQSRGQSQPVVRSSSRPSTPFERKVKDQQTEDR